MGRIRRRGEHERSSGLGGAIVYLIGIPAVGKYTVAKEIGKRTGARVVDNQLVNLPVFTVLGYDGTDGFPFPEGAWDHIATVRRAVFAVIRECCPKDASFVFTNVLEAGDADAEALFRRIEELAVERGVGFFPVWLTCSAEEIRARKDSPDRRQRYKDISVDKVSHYVETFKVLQVSHRNALTLDTSTDEPAVVAQRVIDHVQAVQAG